jgi:hypothetical protein
MANVKCEHYANQFKPNYYQSKSHADHANHVDFNHIRLFQSKDIFFQTYTNYIKPLERPIKDDFMPMQ